MGVELELIQERFSAPRSVRFSCADGMRIRSLRSEHRRSSVSFKDRRARFLVVEEKRRKGMIGEVELHEAVPGSECRRLYVERIEGGELDAEGGGGESRFRR